MPGESTLSVDLVLLALAGLMAANYMFRRSILYPPFMFCGMWLLDLFVYRMNLIPVYSLHGITLMVILMGAICFSLGGVASFFLSRSAVGRTIKLVPNLRKQGEKAKYLWIAILVIGVGVQIQNLFSAAALGLGEGFMNSARVAVVANMIEEDEAGGRGYGHWLGYITSLAIYLSILFRLERKDRLFWISAALALISCISTTGRAQILTLFCALLSVHLIEGRNERFLQALRVVRWPVLLFCGLFSLLAYTNKNTSSNSGTAADFVFAGVVSYIIGPLPSLDQVLMHPWDYTHIPNHTFGFFEKLLTQFGLASIVPPVTLGNLFVPFFSNVYTIYAFFITDFGIPGAMAVMAVIGFLHTLLYRKAHTRSILGKFLFALMLYPLIMSIFADLYTALGIYTGGLLFAFTYLYSRSVSLYGGRSETERTMVLP